jgi:hypothetical protein
VCDNVRTHLHVLVKRVFCMYGYRLDKQEQAAHTVLEQAKVLCAAWASA